VLEPLAFLHDCFADQNGILSYARVMHSLAISWKFAIGMSVQNTSGSSINSTRRAKAGDNGIAG
jgi:hypothetical protein